MGLVCRSDILSCCLSTVKTSDEARDQLDFIVSKPDCCLVIDGDSLQVGLNNCDLNLHSIRKV